MELKQRGEIHVLDPLCVLAFLNTTALVCFEILSSFLVAVPTDISLLSKWLQRKIPLGWAFPVAGTCVVLLPCVITLCRGIPSKGQRECHCSWFCPCLGFNKQYWGNPFSGSRTPQAAILSCCESWRDWALVSAGTEEIWGAAARCGWKWLKGESIHPELGPPSRLASCSKTSMVLWSSAWARSLHHMYPTYQR